MNFGEFRKDLKALVDRPDMSEALAGRFLKRAQVSLERSGLRLVETIKAHEAQARALAFSARHRPARRA